MSKIVSFFGKIFGSSKSNSSQMESVKSVPGNPTLGQKEFELQLLGPGTSPLSSKDASTPKESLHEKLLNMRNNVAELLGQHGNGSKETKKFLGSINVALEQLNTGGTLSQDKATAVMDKITENLYDALRKDRNVDIYSRIEIKNNISNSKIKWPESQGNDIQAILAIDKEISDITTAVEKANPGKLTPNIDLFWEKNKMAMSLNIAGHRRYLERFARSELKDAIRRDGLQMPASLEKAILEQTPPATWQDAPAARQMPPISMHPRTQNIKSMPPSHPRNAAKNIKPQPKNIKPQPIQQTQRTANSGTGAITHQDGNGAVRLHQKRKKN
ncbi:MAG: hypothetical protein LBT64_00745 [Puniceicoccales bacterium]|nr:hypothetical protein [Puniceicoccales bacterium]